MVHGNKTYHVIPTSSNTLFGFCTFHFHLTCRSTLLVTSNTSHMRNPQNGLCTGRRVRDTLYLSTNAYPVLVLWYLYSTVSSTNTNVPTHHIRRRSGSMALICQVNGLASDSCWTTLNAVKMEGHSAVAPRTYPLKLLSVLHVAEDACGLIWSHLPVPSRVYIKKTEN